MDETSLRYEGWRVAAASSVGVLFASLFFITFSVLLKPISEEFSWSREAVSSAYAVMTVAAALSAPLIGHLFDRLGPRWICAPCLMVSGSALASLSALTPHLWHLYAVFALIGLTVMGTSLVVYSRVVTTWFDRRRGMALAVVVSGGAFGAIVHPPATQALIELVGWRGACLTLGGVILATGLPTAVRFVRERPSTTSHLSGGGAGASVGEALRSRIFWILIVVVFGSTVAMNGTIVHLPALLTDRGLPPGRAAMVVSAMGASSLAGRLVTGWLLDRFLATRVSFVLLVVMALGTFLLTASTSFTTGVVAVLLIGFGAGGEFDVTPYLVSRYFGLRSMSALYGLNWTAWGLAGAVGSIAMGRAFDATGSYDGALVNFGVGTLVVAALMLTLPAYEIAPRNLSTPWQEQR